MLSVSLSITALSHRNTCTARPFCDSCHMQGHCKRDTPALVLDGFRNKLSHCMSMMKQPFALGGIPYMKPMFHDRLK